MKKIAVLSLVLFATVLLTAFYTNDKNYDKLWKKVESYQQKGLPKSALKIVDEIYNDAKKEQNKPQKIKALIYKASLSSTYEENYLLKSIALFEKEIPTANSPEKEILYSLTAQLYQQYYSQNRYKILKRKQLAEPEKDPETWDAVQLNKVIESYYLKSMQPEDTLTKFFLEQYKPILVSVDSINNNYYTTLYDLLASRAIDYFSSPEFITTDFSTYSILPDTGFLLPAEDFINIDIPTDTHKNRVLKIYQHIIKSHIADVDPTALVTIDLARIEFIGNKWVVPVGEKGKIIPLLKNLYKKYKTYDVSLQVAQKLAFQYKTLADGYQPEINSSQQFRYYYVKAVDFCKEAVALHPNSPFANNINNIITRLEQPTFSVETEKQLLPGEPFLAKVDFKNITKLYLKIVRIDSKEVLLDPETNSREWAKKDKYLHNHGVRNQTVELTDTKDLQHHITEIKMDKLPLGTYFIYASDSEDFTKSKLISTAVIHVTSLSFITKGEEEGTAFLIQNRKTGVGIEGVKGDVFTINYSRGKNRIEKSFSFTSGKNGFTKGSEEVYSYNSIVRLIKGADTLYETRYLYRYGNLVSKPTVNIYLFTDRSVYRPGQIIYFKGIVVQKDGDKYSILKDYKTEVTLKDVHYKKVSSIKVSSNEYGSFSGSFVIPDGGLNGTMKLQTTKGSVQFSVEEYKRPTFLVEFDTVTGSYKLNDSVTVTGKVNYFNGSPVTDANIVYRVTKQRFNPIPYYWFRPMETPETEVTNGLTKVDENGNFSITFKALPSEGNQSTEFNISADVTDITGEVHSGKTSVKISNHELWVSLGMNEKIDKSLNHEIKLTAVNKAGKPLPVSGKLKIYRLQQPESVFVERYWREPDIWTMSQDEYRTSFPQFAYKGEDSKKSWSKTKVLSKNLTWTGDTTLNTSLIKNLKPSYYKFVFTALDKSGQKVADSITTLIFSSKYKKPVVKKPIWVHLSSETAEPGETVNLIISSAEKKREIYYELTVKDEVVDKRWIKLSKKQTVIPITIQESWRGGVRINLVSVKNNRRYVMVQRIKVPFTNKKLNIKLQTFRDHLTPGNKETWNVKITGFKGNKVAAELLAAMYDASLDQIKKHGWNFNLFHQTYYGNGWFARPFPSTTFYKIRNTRMKILTEYTVEPPQFNWFGMRFSGNNYGVYGIMERAAGANKSMPQKQTVELVDQDNEGVVPAADQDMQNDESAPVKAQQESLNEPVVTRTDFRETAFFYPQLHTDSSGSVVFSFTTPDALTQWKLMMLAHTPDLSSGMEELTFRAYKELMILPNVPRFVRQHDKLMFSARVTNFSDKEQQIKVNLKFFDPVTNKNLNLFVRRMKTEKFLDLKAGESTKVSWLISIPDTINLMAYNIEASSDSYSDAEERVIPVLSNRVLVTETMPMFVNAYKSKKYRFTKLINQEKTASLSTLKNQSFTLEFTSNPAWYAIQALPYLSKPTHESASNLYRAYYSNALSGWIVNSNPKIKAVFDSWSKNSPDAFLSALQKNKKLKNTILEETPWLLEAANESEQKHRIALLFDLNNLKNQQQSTLNKLQQLQKGSGAWPWFNGMGDDRYTTQNIVLGMAKLLDKKVITLDKPEVKNMLNRAVSYLDGKVKEDYENLKKSPKVKLNEMHISNMQIQYLYARVLLEDFFPLNNKYQKAYNYYLNQAQRHWIKESNLLQAMIAVVMYETNNRNEAEAILRSLEERSLYSDELGMYWRTNNSWCWYRAPVETQAMIIEAFSRMNYNPQNIYKMKIWLLKQKQTQHWKSSSATAEAVYALLMTGKSSLLVESKPVSITLANEPLILGDESTPEAGTGYFKKTWSAAEVKPAMGNIEVKNPNNNITWGAAYWQYFEDIDKITASKSPLYVEKKLFVETLTDQGPVLETVDNKKLKTGDKLIIRLVIRTDRNMEFIHLKDVHATGMEVTNQLSGYSYDSGLSYYRDNKDASTNFFIRYLNKGTYVIEYPVFLTQQGSFPVGLATIQSMYAPEFGNHSQGGKIEVVK